MNKRREVVGLRLESREKWEAAANCSLVTYVSGKKTHAAEK